MSGATHLLAALLLASGAAAAGELAFDIEAAPACESPVPLRLLLKDVEIPRSRPVTIRAYAKSSQSEESYIGLLALMGDSAAAAGDRKMPEARITATPAFRQWIKTASSNERLSVILRPFAGKTVLKDLIWSVHGVEWACH